MKSNLIRELKAGREYMSTVEQRIVETLLADPKRFVTYTLGELSQAAQVSQGSIVNFANKFCGGGFPALKMEVAKATMHEGEKPFSVVTEDDSLCEIFRKTADNVSEALHNTTIQNSEEALRAVCDRILAAKKIEIYGFFRSAAVATDLSFQLLQLGVPANFVGDVFTCAVSATMLHPDDLVIAVSSSGQTQELIHAVSLAKDNGVPVVSITAHKHSPLARLSNEILVASPSGNSLSANASEIRLAQLTLGDAICAYLRTRIDADGNLRYFKIREILNSHNVKD